MVTVHFNLQDSSDTGSMCGPTVTVKPGSDESASIEVGSQFGATALTPEEWAALAAQCGDKPYVLVDTAPGRPAFVSPLRTYIAAIAEFRRDTARKDMNYGPHSGRHLAVMSQADYLEASKNWGQS